MAELNKGESHYALVHAGTSTASGGFTIAPPKPSTIGRALDTVRRRGDIMPDALLAHLAPLGWQHINLTGAYLWGVDAGVGPDGFRPLRGTIAQSSLVDEK